MLSKAEIRNVRKIMAELEAKKTHWFFKKCGLCLGYNVFEDLNIQFSGFAAREPACNCGSASHFIETGTFPKGTVLIWDEEDYTGEPIEGAIYP